MKQIRKRLTYANVMSSIAVFLVLGGATAFAAKQLAKNSVGTKQLKNNAVTTAKIKNDAVTGVKVKDGSLAGSDLNLSTLGTVPSATNAGFATKAGSATNADHATNANNATTLGGKPIRWMLTNPSGAIVSQSGNFSVAGHPSSGLYIIDAGSPVTGHAIVVSDGVAGDGSFRGVSLAGPCLSGSGEGIDCTSLAPNANDGNHILVATTKISNGEEEDHSFYLMMY